MKKLTILSLFILHCISLINAQQLIKGTVTDIDGNVYQTVVIGKYEWMSDNLKTTTYKDRTKIPNVSETSVWIALNSGAFCWYNNDSSKAVKYGALYNWYSVETNKLCPDGWRVPSDNEWKYLEGFVDTQYKIGNPIWDKFSGRGYDAGLRLKSTSGWNSDGNGKNDFGFSAIPAGERIRKGKFFLQESNGFWWSSTEYDSTSSIYRCILFFNENIIRGIHPKTIGFSVRCIRNN